MRKNFPIILCLNNHYLRAGLTTFLSILEHRNKKRNDFFQFFIIHEDVHPKLQEYAEKLLNTEVSSLKFIQLHSEHIKFPHGITKEQRPLYYKLYIPQLFKDHDKVLYLDSDIIVKAPITSLFELMPENIALGATRDILHKISREKEVTAPAQFEHITQDTYDRNLLFLTNPDNYFQDGVLLFNIPALDFEHYQKFLSILEVPLWHHTQDILNILFQENIFFFSPQWNWADVPCAYRPRPECSPYLPLSWKEPLKEIALKPSLIHYRDQAKPWQRDGRFYDQDFLNYFHIVNDKINGFEKESPLTLEEVNTLKENIKQEEVFPGEFPVVISYDDNYALYGMTALYSALKTAPIGTKFAFFVLHNGLSNKKQKEANFVFNTENTRIRFINISHIIDTKELPIRWHLSKAIYGRLLIPLLFKKAHYILYLDSDVVIKKDITQITKFMDNTKSIGAVRDIVREADRRLNFTAPETSLSPYGESHAAMSEEYYHRYALKIENPIEHHFQSGVVLFNIPRITDQDIQLMLNTIPQNLWLLDQDILNLIFKDRVSFLDERWNVLCTAYAQERIAILPMDMRLLYQSMIANPYILHYIGCPKPWDETENVPHAQDFLQIMKELEKKLSQKTFEDS